RDVPGAGDVGNDVPVDVPAGEAIEQVLGHGDRQRLFGERWVERRRIVVDGIPEDLAGRAGLGGLCRGCGLGGRAGGGVGGGSASTPWRARAVGACARTSATKTAGMGC